MSEILMLENIVKTFLIFLFFVFILLVFLLLLCRFADIFIYKEKIDNKNGKKAGNTKKFNLDFGRINMKKLYIIPVVIIIAILSINCISIVDTGYVGVVTTFGNVSDNVFNSGLHLKLPVSKVNKMEIREIKNVIETYAFSKDIQEVKVNAAIKYRIKQEKAISIFREQGKNYYSITIEPAFLGALKTSFTSYDAENIIAYREKLTSTIFNSLQEILDKNNIILLEITLQDIDFSDAFTNAVEAKQVATQDKLKAEQEAEKKKIEADGNAYVKIKEAEAEAQANEMKQKSITDNLIKYEQIQKWNGVLPQVEGSSAPIISLK